MVTEVKISPLYKHEEFATEFVGSCNTLANRVSTYIRLQKSFMKLTRAGNVLPHLISRSNLH